MLDKTAGNGVFKGAGVFADTRKKTVIDLLPDDIARIAALKKATGFTQIRLLRLGIRVLHDLSQERELDKSCEFIARRSDGSEKVLDI